MALHETMNRDYKTDVDGRDLDHTYLYVGEKLSGIWISHCYFKGTDFYFVEPTVYRCKWDIW